MKIAKRVLEITDSPTLAIDAKAKEMQKQGINVISFGVGEPDFDTPVNIKEAGIKAIRDGFTKYTAASGIDDLKEAVCRKFRKDNGLEYDKSRILISCGAKHSLHNIFMAVCEPGDEVIIPAPYWVTYPEQVKMADGVPVFLKTEEKDNFRINPSELEKKITKKTVALILNDPGNPTGMVYDEQLLREIGRICLKHKFWIVSDEVYEKLIYDGGKHYSIAAFGEEYKSRTIVVNAASKTYSMTGWRIGYLAGPKDVVKAMSNLQSHATSNPTSFAQKAAVAALDGPEDDLKKMHAEFDKRRKYMVERLRRMKGITCLMPGGAFYTFPNISKLNIPSMAFAEKCLNDAKIAVVPGVAFGAEGYIRLSYATSMEKITEGMNRLEAIL